MATWYEKISYFANLQSTPTKLQTPGFSLTRHKKPRKCGIFGGAKRVGFWLRTDLSQVLAFIVSYFLISFVT